jgi:DNA invertase Pin-like site-specific DNA recombinase
MKTAALYARIDSPAEHIDDQLLALRSVAAKRGYEVVEYIDVACGPKVRRPGLHAMMRDAREKRFDIILVPALDRLARTPKHFLQVVKELSDLGIGFLSLQENICTRDEMGEQFLTLTRSLLKLHCDLNTEVIRAGIRRRRLEGYRLGRKPLAINHAALVRDRLAGMSLTDTARKWGVSRSSVVNYVREHQKHFAEMKFQPDTNVTNIGCVA